MALLSEMGQSCDGPGSAGTRSAWDPGPAGLDAGRQAGGGVLTAWGNDGLCAWGTDDPSTDGVLMIGELTVCAPGLCAWGTDDRVLTACVPGVVMSCVPRDRLCTRSLDHGWVRLLGDGRAADDVVMEAAEILLRRSCWAVLVPSAADIRWVPGLMRMPQSLLLTALRPCRLARCPPWPGSPRCWPDKLDYRLALGALVRAGVLA